MNNREKVESYIDHTIKQSIFYVRKGLWEKIHQQVEYSALALINENTNVTLNSNLNTALRINIWKDYESI